KDKKVTKRNMFHIGKKDTKKIKIPCEKVLHGKYLQWLVNWMKQSTVIIFIVKDQETKTLCEWKGITVNYNDSPFHDMHIDHDKLEGNHEGIYKDLASKHKGKEVLV